MATVARLESDPVDERAIIARCLAGERRAYAVLVERYKGLVHDLVSRMLGDAVEAEDIAQDAFVKAYLSLKSFRGESKFSTWVCRIALNDARTSYGNEVARPGRGPATKTGRSWPRWPMTGKRPWRAWNGASARQRSIERLPGFP